MPPRASLRLVVDTNVFISSLLSGPMMRLARIAFTDHTLLYSVEQLVELKEVMSRRKIRARIIKGNQEELITSLWVHAELVPVRSSVRICRDPDDDHFLALSVDGLADILITGDKDLLVLKKFNKTRIITPGEFMAAYA